METWELAAREGIRDTIARYNHAGDRGRIAEMVACFADDGMLEVHGASIHTGHAALHEFFGGVATGTSAPSGLHVLRHCVTNTLIEVASPVAAQANSYFQVITDIGLDHWGTYRDRFVHDGRTDRWLLAHRSVKTDGYAAGSFFA